MADWIEAGALFNEEKKLACSSLVDILIQEEIYVDQGFCWDGVDEGLRELRRRTALNSGFPLSISGRRFDTFGARLERGTCS